MTDDEIDYSAPMAPRWSNLPVDILSAIAKLLSSDIDLLRLRSVCSSWRSSLPPPPPKRFSFPLKVSPLYAWGTNGRDDYFLLHENTLYRLSPPADPSSGWLFKVSEIKPNTFALLNPLLRDKIKDTQGITPKHLNLLNYGISEICKSYSLEFVHFVGSSEQSQSCLVRMTIALWNYVAGCDFAILALHYGGGMDLWKFGDENWTEIDIEHHRFEDLIFCGGKCYAIDRKGVIVYFDSKLNMTEMDMWPMYLPNQQIYLVECKSELFMVRKLSYLDPLFYYDYFQDVHEPIVDRTTFKVQLRFIISKVSTDPDNIGNLGDKILLLGDGVRFSISTKDFAGCKGNCFYLTDDCFYDDGVDSVYGNNTGVYDLDDKRVEALVMAHDYARIFWPPPSWLLPDESSPQG